MAAAAVAPAMAASASPRAPGLWAGLGSRQNAAAAFEQGNTRKKKKSRHVVSGCAGQRKWLALHTNDSSFSVASGSAPASPSAHRSPTTAARA